MSILIRGMEMPKDGFITITVTSDGRVVGNSKKESGKFEYLDNEDIAKAIPVPPHGDLIDRDTLLASENQHYEIHSDSFYVETRTIELAPTIIEKEE